MTTIDPLPGVTRVRPAAHASRLACGCRVQRGSVIVHRGGRWVCLRCAVAAIRAARKAVTR